MTKLNIGVDIGGSHIAVGVVDESGNLLLTLDHQLLNNSTVSSDEIISIIYGLISQATFTLFDRENCSEGAAGGSGGGGGSFDGKFNTYIASVGIGCPGHCKNGVLVAASNLPLLKNAPLASKLSVRLDGVPVVLVNDADAAVAAEVWSKDTCIAYRDAENVAMITLGTGIGVGLVLNRRLFSGSNGLVEAGHMIVPPPTAGSALASSRRCGCGQQNCVETYSSAKAVATRYAEALKALTPTPTTTDEQSSKDAAAGGYIATTTDTRGVFHLAANGDQLAERIIDEAAKGLAVLVVNLCRVVDPDIIVFGGGMSQSGDPLLHRVRAHLKSTTWTVLPTTVQLVLAKSSVNAGILGAAMAGKQEAVSRGGPEGGAFGHFMRIHGQSLLAVTSTISVISLGLLAMIALQRNSGRK